MPLLEQLFSKYQLYSFNCRKIRPRERRKTGNEERKRLEIVSWKFEALGGFALNSGFGTRGVLNPRDGLWNDFMADQRLAVDCIRGSRSTRVGVHASVAPIVRTGRTISTVWQRGARPERIPQMESWLRITSSYDLSKSLHFERVIHGSMAPIGK